MRILFLTFAISVLTLRAQNPGRLENMHGKTVMLFTPHPDDDIFCRAGTAYKPAKNGNHIRIVIYPIDDKGSYDSDMTSERLARVRMLEEEQDCRIALHDGHSNGEHSVVPISRRHAAMRAAEWRLYF